MSEHIEVNVCKNGQPIERVTCDGYVLLSLKGGMIVPSGNIDLKTLTPILMKIMMERMTK